jgi:hypothetical protein
MHLQSSVGMLVKRRDWCKQARPLRGDQASHPWLKAFLVRAQQKDLQVRIDVQAKIEHDSVSSSRP